MLLQSLVKNLRLAFKYLLIVALVAFVSWHARGCFSPKIERVRGIHTATGIVVQDTIKTPRELQERLENKREEATKDNFFQRIVYAEPEIILDTVYVALADSVVKGYSIYDFPWTIRKSGNELRISTINLDRNLIREWRSELGDGNFSIITSIGPPKIFYKRSILKWNGLKVQGNYEYPSMKPYFSLGSGFTWMDRLSTDAYIVSYGELGVSASYRLW